MRAAGELSTFPSCLAPPALPLYFPPAPHTIYLDLMSTNAGHVNCNVFTIMAMAAKQWPQIKPLSSRMSVILILSIGSFKGFYCCFRSFFPSFLGLLDMHGAWWLDESFGSGSARWHWSHVPPCKCPLWMSFTARVSESRPAHFSQFLSRSPSELYSVLNPRLSFSALSVSPLSLTAFLPPTPSVALLPKRLRCCTRVWPTSIFSSSK